MLAQVKRSPPWCMGLVMLLAAAASAEEPVMPPSEPEESISVKIRARAFEPSTIVLHAGRKIRLTFQNQDAELHAFVPLSGLFDGVNLNLGGNGAPEFGAEGFKRVIIPSDGRAEFRFVSDRPGSYPFICDMPGHNMRGTILVE
jgi:plastocyanin